MGLVQYSHNKVVVGSRVYIDLTGDSVTAERMFEGDTAHDKTGKQITGAYAPGAIELGVGEIVDGILSATITLSGLEKCSAVFLKLNTSYDVPFAAYDGNYDGWIATTKTSGGVDLGLSRIDFDGALDDNIDCTWHVVDSGYTYYNETGVKVYGIIR